jgi:hypothetical protein
MFRRLCAGLLTAALVFLTILPVLAGTTGGLRGRIIDRDTQHGIAGVRVTAASPSQSATTTTDANGGFVFLSLSPDTYTLSVSPPGYDAAVQSGITVVSDQVQTASLTAVKTLRTIGRTTSRSSSNIVRPGTINDVYSVNASAQEAAKALGGPGSLNQAYSGMASVPGISVPQGQQGWNQLVYVRGGDYEDVAVELDGIPMIRQSDSAPQSTLSTLGQQELQVYSGGAPASADVSGLSGYVNQVIRTGTYPGFEDLQVGVGGPAYYHKLSLEVGGATQNRNFSYYVGFSGVDQDYRYGDQFNGASNNNAFFAPLYIPSNQASTNATGTAIYDGSGTPYFTPGQTYSIANTSDRETVANFHFGLPHKDGQGKDDIQLLYVTSDILAQFYSSPNDLGGLGSVGNALTEQYSAPTVPTFIDSYVYKGSLMTPLTGNEALTPELFPSSGNHAFGTTELNGNQRDSNDNGIGLLKLQYQKNINDHSYFRIFGYSNYSNWFINGPVSANLNYGGELADYEVDSHTYGVNARYENQLNSKNLLTLTASYQTGKLQTYSNGSNGGMITTNLVDSKGNCYSLGGTYASCFTSIYNSDGSVNPLGGLNEVSQFGAAIPGYPGQNLVPGTPPAGSPAALHGANWVVTENGQNAQIDTVSPFFTAYSLSDQFRPSDKLTINAGVRLENFLYRLNYSAADYPARAFWFNAYNRENCYTPGSPAPVSSGTINPLTGAFPGCAANSIGLVDTAPNTSQYSALEPRVGTTYTINPDTVLRASYGRYAQQPGTSYQLFNTTAQNEPNFISQFLPYGYDSPYHETTPSYSNSYDFSLEKHLHGTDYSFKLTPFYRSTQDELQSVPIGAQGVLDGINTGTGRNYGVEFEFSKGDFARPGLAYQLAYTYTNSRISFGNFASGNNFIDNLNAYVKQYNGFTSACAANPSSPLCGSTSGAAAPCYVAGAPAACGAAGSYDNPYWNAAPQPLFDRSAEYTPYDILPSPFQGANGYVVPNLLTGVVNYRVGKLSLTPSATYSSGSYYGSPLTWPGYDPTTCTGATATETLQQSCSGYLFIPDLYTGKFDNQGVFRQPTRFTLNFQTAYEFNRRVRAVLTLTGLIDHCYQRGYPWDNQATCVYAQLPSNHLAPVGNFLTGTGIPVPQQLAYPYSSWYNNSQTGYVGQRIPFGAFFNLEIRL